jgi:fumarylpyruvate hydrolase
MQLAVTLPATRTLAIAGRTERFPVHRIFCVGRNYAAHAREMGADAREPPFFFMKPGSAAVDASAPISIAYPPKTANFHHEIELVVAIGQGGANIPLAQALEHVYAYAVGLDMTRRDLQFAARDKGRPWEFGKSFADSAPIGALHRAADIGHPASAAISVAVNGQTKQSSDIAKLIWSVAECIAELSQYDRLEAGDLIMTGTPEGVGPVKPGEEMLGAITGLGEIRVRVAG